MTEDLSVPKRYSFDDPNTALRLRDMLSGFIDGKIDGHSPTDRYGYVLDISDTGPEYPSARLEFGVVVDANGNVVDPILIPNSLDNPPRATYARIITDDGFEIRARISPEHTPVFRKAEFFDKMDPSGEGVMIDERGVYVNVQNVNGVSSIVPSSYPWLIDQGGELVVIEPQVAPRVHVSGRAGSYYVVSIVRGIERPVIDLEKAKEEILATKLELEAARAELDAAATELGVIQDEMDQVATDVSTAAGDAASALAEATQARADALAAHGLASDATVEAQDAWNGAVAAQEAALESSLVLTVSSTGGQLLRTDDATTTLIATVYQEGVELTEPQITELGIIRWYRGGIFVSTGTSLLVNAPQVTPQANYTARLETA